jgi:glutamate 5-kinase
VLLTNTDGLFTADPRRDPNAELVAEITDLAQLDELTIGHQASPLGSGGMRSKVVAAEMATAAGIEVVIANGLVDGTLTTAAEGGAIGTRFRPAATRQPSFKLWLKYAKPTRGRILVDDGAARALRDGGTSLLPVGITAVEGTFDAGDAVEVINEGRTIGKGICAYSATDLRRVQGLQSAQVRERMGGAAEEAVHRDYFVLA